MQNSILSAIYNWWQTKGTSNPIHTTIETFYEGCEWIWLHYFAQLLIFCAGKEALGRTQRIFQYILPTYEDSRCSYNTL